MHLGARETEENIDNANIAKHELLVVVTPCVRIGLPFVFDGVNLGNEVHELATNRTDGKSAFSFSFSFLDVLRLTAKLSPTAKSVIVLEVQILLAFRYRLKDYSIFSQVLR